MRTYLLFLGDHYYPVGGYADYVGTFATEAAAHQFLNTHAMKTMWDFGTTPPVAKTSLPNWWQIVACDDGVLTVIEAGQGEKTGVVEIPDDIQRLRDLARAT